jgi:hypothetical protein
MRLRRKTRETHRHDRATVYQELGDQAVSPLDWKRQRAIEERRIRKARKQANDTPGEDQA